MQSKLNDHLGRFNESEEKSSLLSSSFNKYRKERLVVAPEVFSVHYVPDTITHRRKEYEEIIYFLSPIMDKSPPLPFLIFGNKGSGKTHVIKYIFKNDIKIVNHHYHIPVTPVYVSCRVKTSPRILQSIYRQLDPEKNFPQTGIHPSVYLDKIISYMQENPSIYIFCLDDAEQIKDEYALELLLTMNEVRGLDLKYSVCIISSNMMFRDRLSESIKSRLFGNKIVFSSYSVNELTDIVIHRASIGLRPGTLPRESAVLIAIKSYGDARRAIKLLYNSALVCEKNGSNLICEDDIVAGEKLMEETELMDYIIGSSIQQKIILISLLHLKMKCRDVPVSTQTVYTRYKEICDVQGIRPLTRMMVSNLLEEFINNGLVDSEIVNLGKKGGRVRLYRLTLDDKELINMITKESTVNDKRDEYILEMLETVGILKHLHKSKGKNINDKNALMEDDDSLQNSHFEEGE